MSLDLAPRQIALLVTFVGFVIAQAIINHFVPDHRKVVQVAGAMDVSKQFVPSAKNPAELVSRVEVYHAPPLVRSQSEALEHFNLSVNAEDRVQFLPDPALGVGSQITIIRATPIMLDNGGSQTYLRTFHTTVKEFLDEQGVLVGASDTVDPSLDAELWWGGRVVVTRVEAGEYVAIEDIRYDEQVRPDSNLFADESTVIREGKRGKREVTVRVRRENGQEVVREVLAEHVLSLPTTKIVRRGTKLRPATGRWEDLINEIAPRYFADPVGLTKIMMCESGGNLTSYNPAGPYFGMFQFDEYTFTRIAGHPMDEIHDAAAQIDGAAKLYSARYWHWPVCSRGT